MKITGVRASDELLLLAHAVDRLSILIWQKTKDGSKGRNKPPMIAEAIIGSESRKKVDVIAFETADAFWESRQKIIEGRS